MLSRVMIAKIANNCDQCNALKSIPKKMIKQTSSPSPTAPGREFASDVMRRNKQNILVTRDTLSSFTSAKIVPDETAPSLRTACTIRVDRATGLQALVGHPMLGKY